MVELELPRGVRQERENKHVGTWLESACTIMGIAGTWGWRRNAPSLLREGPPPQSSLWAG